MHNFRHQKQSGFTLIELVIVLVIIGILAAVAIPKFTSLTTDAQSAATVGVAGALSSANSTNYAMRSAGLGGTNTFAVLSCGAVSNALQGGLPNSQYTISGTAPGVGATVTNCLVSGPGNPAATAFFVATGVN